ncbi:MAG: RNA polymerase sigma factor RpoH [Rickettsiales bacterium]|nr:RNA polymerase sigma factor RpoH [Rickettsiales bacterium]
MSKALAKSVNFRSAPLPAHIADGGIAEYINMVRNLPRLNAEEEVELARKVRNDKDLAAAEQLIKSNLYLVVATAFEYRGYGLPMADIISEGNIGLMKAVKKYDPEKGFRLSTYALWWIRAAINEFVLGSWSLVKLGTQAASKKLFFGLKRIKAKLGIYHDSDMTPAEVAKVAEHLKVDRDEVVEMNRRLARDVSLNKPSAQGDDDGAELVETLAAETPDAEALTAEHDFNYKRMKMLLEALDALSEREREVIRRRRMQDSPATLDELAAELKISKERVRQIESAALEKLKKNLTSRRAELSD